MKKLLKEAEVIKKKLRASKIDGQKSNLLEFIWENITKFSFYNKFEDYRNKEENKNEQYSINFSKFLKYELHISNTFIIDNVSNCLNQSAHPRQPPARRSMADIKKKIQLLYEDFMNKCPDSEFNYRVDQNVDNDYLPFVKESFLKYNTQSVSKLASIPSFRHEFIEHLKENEGALLYQFNIVSYENLIPLKILEACCD